MRGGRDREVLRQEREEIQGNSDKRGKGNRGIETGGGRDVEV